MEMDRTGIDTRIVIQKFGGTSVGSIERIEAVAERIDGSVKKGIRPVVVASAMSGETNRLARLAHDLNPFYKGMAYDMLLASGEQVSIALLTIALEKRGLRAMPLLAHQLGIQTDSIYSKARIQNINKDRLLHLIKNSIIPVVAGFQGVSPEDCITTLGRGGSDTTAVALSVALGHPTCEIYTDVPAVFSADPRLVPEAREIRQLCFPEMMEMASMGAKVLHFRCVELAAKFDIKVHVRSTFKQRGGTWVVPETENMEAPVVTSVTHDPSTAIFKIFPTPKGGDYMAKLFNALAKKHIVIDIITQSSSKEGERLAFSISEDHVTEAQGIVVETLGSQKPLEIIQGLAKISTIGVGMKNHPGVAARFFAALNQARVPIHLVTTSDIKISAVVNKEHLSLAAQTLHSEFQLDK